MHAAGSLVGRVAEHRTLTAACRDALAGRPGPIVIRGPAGAGKSTLLTSVVESVCADVPAATVVRVGGHPAEVGVPYSGLDQLIRFAGLDVDLGTLGDDPRRDAGRLLSAMTSAAAEAPMLLVIDDLHWIDLASRRTLIFVIRRLSGEPLAWLGAQRTGALRDGAGFDGAGFEGAGSEGSIVVDLPALGQSESLRLLQTRFSEMSSFVAIRIAEHAAGLPLALCEIPMELTSDQRRGVAPLPVDLPAGRSMTELFAGRIEPLPDSTRLATLAVAYDPLDLAATRRVLARLGRDLADLDPAERCGLVRVAADVTFRHPSVPAAIRELARGRERLAVHRALAPEFVDDPARAAPHLREDPDLPASERAHALEGAARAAATGGLWASAADFWDAAADHTVDAVRSRECRREATRALVLAGAGPEAHERLDALAHTADGDVERAGLYGELVAVSLWSRLAVSDRVPEIVEYGTGLLRSSDRDVREAGATLLLTVAVTEFGTGGFGRADRVCRLVRNAVPEELTLEQRLVCDVAGVVTGAVGAGDLLRSDWLDDYPWQRVRELGSIGFIAVVADWLGAEDLVAGIVDRCDRTVDVVGPSAAARYVIGCLRAAHDVATGDWDAAIRQYRELGDLVLANDFAGPYLYVTLRHALLLASRGDRAGCDQVRRHGMAAAATWSPAMAHLAHCAAGSAALADGDPETALDELSAGARLERSMGLVVSGFLPRLADEFEAAWQLGVHAPLRATVDEFEQRMRAVAHPWLPGLAVRCRALEAPVAELDEAFGRAVDALVGEPSGFEVARTRLLWGRRLRRARRKADARRQLSAAQQRFRELGADGWVAQCSSELAACGVRRAMPATAACGVAADLTPRELEVARAVAKGASNAAAAQRLFLSERTVETHLARVFRKLGISRRGQLADVLSRATARG